LEFFLTQNFGFFNTKFLQHNFFLEILIFWKFFVLKKFGVKKFGVNKFGVKKI